MRRSDPADLLLFPCDEFLRLAVRAVTRAHKVRGDALIAEGYGREPVGANEEIRLGVITPKTIWAGYPARPNCWMG